MEVECILALSSGLPHNIIMLPIEAASSTIYTPQICSAQFVMLNFNLLAEHTQITWSVSLLLLQSLPAASHISPAISLYGRVCVCLVYLWHNCR